MNVYDEANNLARALKESTEYKNFLAAKEKLEQDPEKYEMAKDYMRKQMEIQSFQMLGNELTEDQITSYNAIANTIMGIPEIAEFFQAQMYFSVVFQDITDIMAKAVDLDMGLFDSEEEGCGA
ncbi:YlbF family regulator [Acetobacterium malicum]|uniref:YlbF family regulator n=1 Tax=Acetobacterium malicum TaxID=52692 RepID=UPI0004027D34|nr:YlbF family regulator [Acetobacterium dehalogenans]